MEFVARKDTWLRCFGCAWVLLLAGLVAGIAVADWINAMPTETMPLSTGDQPAARERSPWELFAFILRRNMTVYVVLLLGVVSAGLVTIVVLVGNGMALGQLIGFAGAAGMSLADVANLLLPHGVLELGALCVAGAVGLKGIPLAFSISSVNRQSVNSLRLGTVLVFGLVALTVAAGVEAFVTAEIADSIRAKR